MIDHMKVALKSVKANLIAAQIRMKEYADQVMVVRNVSQGNRGPTIHQEIYELIYISHQSYKGGKLDHTT